MLKQGKDGYKMSTKTQYAESLVREMIDFVMQYFEENVYVDSDV